MNRRLLSRTISPAAQPISILDHIQLSYRGRGIAQAMVRWLHHHPELAEVERWLLITRDAGPVYAPLGYALPDDMDRFMQRRS